MGKIKIYISASNQDYNRSTGQPTVESEQCGIISDKEAELLRATGRFEVKVGKMDGMYAKIAEANAWGADLYTCNHTNAGGGNGSRLFYYTEGGEGQLVCQAIAKYLFPLSPGPDDRIKRNDLLETREPKAPCAYAEIEFHDNAEGAAWIVAHPDQIAEALAHGICDHYGVAWGFSTAPAPTPAPAPAEGEKIRHRVMVDAQRQGSYADKAKAEAVVQQLKALNVTAHIETVTL